MSYAYETIWMSYLCENINFSFIYMLHLKITITLEMVFTWQLRFWVSSPQFFIPRTGLLTTSFCPFYDFIITSCSFFYDSDKILFGLFYGSGIKFLWLCFMMPKCIFALFYDSVLTYLWHVQFHHTIFLTCFMIFFSLRSCSMMYNSVIALLDLFYDYVAVFFVACFIVLS